MAADPEGGPCVPRAGRARRVHMLEYERKQWFPGRSDGCAQPSAAVPCLASLSPAAALQPEIICLPYADGKTRARSLT